MEGAGERENFTLSAAPVLGAMGLDHEAKHAEWNLRSRRAKALYELVKVLKETEDERAERKNKSQELNPDFEALKQYLS